MKSKRHAYRIAARLLSGYLGGGISYPEHSGIGPQSLSPEVGEELVKLRDALAAAGVDQDSDAREAAAGATSDGLQR